MLLDIDPLTHYPLKGWIELNVHTPDTVNAFHPSHCKKHDTVTFFKKNIKCEVLVLVH